MPRRHGVSLLAVVFSKLSSFYSNIPYPSNANFSWKKGDPAVNAIENELYLSAAAKLANRKPSTPSGGYYFNEAIKAYEWFYNSGMINGDFLINDGLTSDCKNNGAATWSYNQGVILGGLTELTWSTGDQKYTTLAVNIATATITHLTNADGILTDACGTCGGDGAQFKGVFVRNVQFMYNRANGLSDATKAQFKAFLQLNADTVWEKDQQGNFLGPVWSGPYINADVNSQSSALDLLVAAAGVSDA
jgi:predicted alpha-1,6-mannanase (GH76 family)